MLATLCSLGKTHVEDARNRFVHSQFINDRVLPPRDFVQKTKALVESFTKATKNDFAHAMDWIYLTFSTNYFLAGDNIHYRMTMSGDGKVNVVALSFRMASPITTQVFSGINICSCAHRYTSCTIIPLI
jgi:hypothetical protein